MTRERYFDMLDQLGSEPIEEEIPIELGDLPLDIQDIMELYRQLEDRYSEMSGIYMGKSFVWFSQLHEIICSDLDKLFCLRILRYIDSIRIEDYQKRSKPVESSIKIPKTGE